MHNLKRRIMGSLMAVLMSSSTILGTCPTPMFAVASNDATVETEVTSDATSVDANQYGLVSVTEGNILHAWDWKFTDVTKGIEEIVEAGYSVVQVSPCQTCESAATNNDWWKLYQPYDYSFGNSLGSEEEFKEMCDTAEKYGVSIVVDVVANHVAGTGKGTCGDRKPEVNSWWTDDKFHNTNIKFTGDYDNDREKMVTSNIGMPDIATEKEDVQKRMISYLETMLDMGADGFRYDAAKHIGTTSDTGKSQDTFWKNISAAVAAKRPDALVYGEILNNMPVSDKYYVNDGIKVTESQKGWDMKDLLQGTGTVSQKSAFTYKREASADKLITWVENHDTYLNHWGSTGLQGHPNYMSDEQIILAWSTVGARADAQALFFARPDGCSNPDNPNDNDASNKIEGDLGRSTKNNIWKDKRVAAVNKFKNAMVGEKESCSTSGNVAIIQRGNKGVVATNFGGSDATVEVSGLSGLKDGTYKDAANGGSITVSGGKASISVKAKSFVVLYDADATPVETEVPATIEPTETPVEDAAKVTVSKDSGTFEKSFDVDVKVENAEYAYYSYDGADWAKIKDGKAKVTVGEDAKEVGDAFALYVKAKGKDGKTVDVTKTYTYGVQTIATAEPVAKGLNIRVKASEIETTTPSIYVYDETHQAADAYTGKWPGKAMTKDGDYYVYSNEEITGTVSVIINDNTDQGWKIPSGKDAPGFDAKGSMELSGGQLVASTGTTTTSAPATVSPNAKKAGKAPEFVEPNAEPTPTAVVETPTPAPEAPTPVVEVTEEPPVVVETPSISVDVADGSEFDTETMKVTVTVKNATNATYTIDGGVTKSFSDRTEVTLGEGKIADSEVTLTVTATDGKENIEKTYTYKKVFNPGKAAESQEVKISAIVKIQSAMEIVEDAAQTNTPAESEGPYSTNPNGNVGKEATITIDGKFDDWSEDMLIAQGGAWDIANNFKGGHENCVLDDYALYAAWDNDNLYIGWQMVNTTDTWHNKPGDGPLSDGGRVLDVPLMLALNVGNRDAMTGKMANGKLIWDVLDVSFETRVDNILLMSGKVGEGTPGYFIAADKSGGASYDPEYCLSFKNEGISYKMAEGCLPKSIMMLEGATGVSDVYDMSKYVDAMSKNHDTTYDSFYEINIPLKTLGIDKSYLEQNGIGVMQIATRGISGIDCIPHDPTMLDNATGDCAVDKSTSKEKDDPDVITVPLAAVGNMKASGEGSGGNPNKPVVNPTVTPDDDKKDDAETTPEPVGTPDVDEDKKEQAEATATPVVTLEVTEVPAEPEVTATPVVTEAPAEPVKVEISETDKMVVNFGADKSAPQMSGTELTLEARPQNVAGTCQYQFAIDGELVQGYSENSTYVWTANAGSHTIQVSVKDEENKTVVVEKQYSVEGEVLPTKEPEATATTEPTVAPTPTAPVNVDNSQKVPNAAITSSIKASLTVNPAKSAAVKTKVTLVPNVTGFKTSYTYSIVAKKSDGTVTQIVKDSNAASATWVPKETGTYTLTLKVIDAEKNETSFDVPSYKITKLKLSTAKASKKTIKAGSKVKFTAKATNVSGSVKYQFVVKKGSKKIATRKYNKKATYTWTAKKTLKAGTYKCVITAKDSSGVKVSKTVSVKVKAKAKAKKAKK